MQWCLTDECFFSVSCAHQKSVSVLGKDLEGIFGGVNLESAHCRVRRGAEVLFVMDLQWLHEGGVKDQVIPGICERLCPLMSSVCFFSGKIAFVLIQNVCLTHTPKNDCSKFKVKCIHH